MRVTPTIKVGTDETPTVTVDLNGFDLELAQGFASGVGIVRVDILRDGKRVTAHLDIFKHALKRDPTLRLTVVNRARDVTRTAQVRPWTPEPYTPEDDS